MKEKLTELEMHRLHEALRNSSEVLRKFKQRSLSKDGVKWMQNLEEAVDSLNGLIIRSQSH